MDLGGLGWPNRKEFWGLAVRGPAAKSEGFRGWACGGGRPTLFGKSSFAKCVADAELSIDQAQLRVVLATSCLSSEMPTSLE